MNAQALAQPALAPPAMEQDASGGKCYDCPPAKKYDSEEVIKTTKDVDHSRVINTTTEVPVGRRVKETNHLIIHQNETRNVGVIRHNNTIIDREVRYVRPVEIVVNVVTQRYRVVHRPALYEVVVPAVHRPAKRCKNGTLTRYGSCRRVLRVRG